ncbi:MAG: hypothetical protein IKB82_04085 [Clostridia bacterium]|nr:hypothetical protein [Clostridia bacterium]
MGEQIKVDMLLLEDIAGELSKLSHEIERLERELRLIRYSMPRDVETLVQLEVMHEHHRLSEATDRASGLVRRVRRATELFDHCERMLLHRADTLDSGTDLESFSSANRPL